MEVNDLIEIGFNTNEAKVYLELIKLRKASARQIINTTKFHKNIVYDNLNKLIDKGLVTYINEKSKKVYQISDSSNLMDPIIKKEKDILIKKQKTKIISKEINKISKEFLSKSEATIYRGVSGIKTFYNETLVDKRDFFIFGAPLDSIKIMGETFWKSYENKRIHKKIKSKRIFNTSIKEFKKIHGKHDKDRRYFEEGFEPLTETFIQGDKVAIIVWAKEPLLFLIKDESIAKSYLGYFKKLWNISKN
ncbi:hypothetical protein GOV12_07480 [Candidatus Pacearchaeota archaeon]|nr:hypothetical protein [Candidatus Pacearchaeota archaeon]